MISLLITATFSTSFASAIQKNKIAQITQLIQASDIANNTIRQRNKGKTVQAYTTYTNARNQNEFSKNKIYTSNNKPLKPNKIDTQNNFVWSTYDGYKVRIPKQGRGAITVEKIDHYSFTLSFPNQDETIFTGQGEKIIYNTILYTEYQNNTDVVVETYEDSIRVLTVLNNADTPTKYRYKIHIPRKGKIKKLQDGGIIILDQNETLFGGFTPPLAIDKKGRKIPTHYEIKGDELIQVIDHLNVNVTYPIVAGSYGGTNLIHHANWMREYILGQWRWILDVHPTQWANIYSNNYLIGVYGAEELVRETKIYTNAQGLKDQYICKQKYTNYRDTFYRFYLNEWRPYIGYDATVKDKCNPEINN